MFWTRDFISTFTHIDGCFWKPIATSYALHCIALYSNQNHCCINSQFFMQILKTFIYLPMCYRVCTLCARIKYRELISFHCSTYSERLFQSLTNILHIHRHMDTWTHGNRIYSQYNSFLWFWRNTIQFPSILSFTHTKCYYKLNFNPLHVKFTSGKKSFHLCTYHAYTCVCLCVCVAKISQFRVKFE